MNDDLLTAPPSDYRLPRRTGIWLLLSSVLLNFFLLGLLVAPLLLQPHRPQPPFGPHGNFVDHLTQGLPPADAALLKTAYAKQEVALTSGQQGMDTAMRAVTEVLSKPEVNQTELQKALAGVAAAHGTIENAMRDLINFAASALSPEGRRLFAENGLRPHGPPPFGEHHQMPPPNMMLDMPPPHDRPE